MTRPGRSGLEGFGGGGFEGILGFGGVWGGLVGFRVLGFVFSGCWDVGGLGALGISGLLCLRAFWPFGDSQSKALWFRVALKQKAKP